MTRFDRQRMLVLGCSSGIGRAIAAAGADVTIASRSADRLAAAAPVIKPAVNTAVLDLTDEAAVEAFCAQGQP